jgi:hypothetical protein
VLPFPSPFLLISAATSGKASRAHGPLGIAIEKRGGPFGAHSHSRFIFLCHQSNCWEQQQTDQPIMGPRSPSRPASGTVSRQLPQRLRSAKPSADSYPSTKFNDRCRQRSCESNISLEPPAKKILSLLRVDDKDGAGDKDGMGMTLRRITGVMLLTKYGLHHTGNFMEAPQPIQHPERKRARVGSHPDETRSQQGSCTVYSPSDGHFRTKG